jgi:DtxR family Mn-dependent transcriptional regulator
MKPLSWGLVGGLATYRSHASDQSRCYFGSAAHSESSAGKLCVPSLTVENYVKAIYQISATQDDQPVSTGQLAATLGVSPGTVTSMLKTLDAAELATHTPYEGVALSKTGRVLALRVIRRHRLIEQFLVETLAMTWDEVHEEAEHMEHAVSDLLVDRIDAYLGRPEVDPHGDPIPRGDMTALAEAVEAGRPLSAVAVGERFRIVRVLDQSPPFLRYLAETGLVLEAIGHVERAADDSGLVQVRLGKGAVTLPADAAASLIVTTEE